LSPKFFIQFKADPGAMLSGIFAIVTLMYIIELSKNEFRSFRFLMSRIALFTWLSIEAKPQFSSLLIFLIAYFILKEKNYQLLAPFLVVTSIPMIVLFKDRILKSPFLESANSDSPYAVVFEPISIINGMLYYLEKTFTIGTLLLFGLTVIMQIARKQFSVLLLLTGLMLSILFPLALIPNHLLPPYAWFGTYALAIWLTIGLNSVLGDTKDLWLGKISLVIAIIVAFLFSKNVYSSKYFDFNKKSIQIDTYTSWILDRQAENSNLEKSTRIVAEKNLKNILFGGVYGPWHLFRNSDFVRTAYPELSDYYVYLQKSESIWNSVARGMDTGVSEDDIYRLRLDWVVLVDQRGVINEIIPWSKFKLLEKSIQVAALDTGFLLEDSSEGRIKYHANRSVIETLMKANSHDLFLKSLQRLYE
jgi:hypothetical protein